MKRSDMKMPVRFIGVSFGLGAVAVGVGGFLLALFTFVGASSLLMSPALLPSADLSPWGLELEMVRLREVSGGHLQPQPRWDEEKIRRFVASFRTGLSKEEERELAHVIYEECKAYGFAPRFVLSVIAIESAFVPTSVSSKGAVGLMQIRPFVAKALAPEVKIQLRRYELLRHPSINVRLGMRYLFRLILRYRDLSLALIAYNMGPTRLEGLLRREKSPPRRYAERVKGFYRTL